MKSSEVSELVIATDAGREGELVARWIIEKVGFNKPMKRLWISSMTDMAIKDMATTLSRCQKQGVPQIRFQCRSSERFKICSG